MTKLSKLGEMRSSSYQRTTLHSTHRRDHNIMAVIATTASEDASAGRSEDCGSAEQMNIVGLIIDQLIFDSCMTKFVTFLKGREGPSVRTSH